VIEDYWANAVYSVTPTILVGLIFWLIIRSILRADRIERKVFADMESQERERRGLARAEAAGGGVAAARPSPPSSPPAAGPGSGT